MSNKKKERKKKKREKQIQALASNVGAERPEPAMRA